MKLINLLGSRIVKTGLAVFLTALVCQLFGWPPVFAVITAIVTLEPTVSDSIKKGIIRFPASVIGSAYAVVLIYFFGNSPITYALAAVLTIGTCYKLKLHAGLLVAMLTAVTMVEVVDSNHFIAFATRLGTTSIGLLVSTGVNMVILPPNYRKQIMENTRNISDMAANILEAIFANILQEAYDNNLDQAVIDQLRHEIRATEGLTSYQNNEARYHPLAGEAKAEYLKAEEQLASLRTLHYHLDNLNRLPIRQLTWTVKERDFIRLSIRKLQRGLRNEPNYDFENHEKQLKQITQKFWSDNQLMSTENAESTKFTPEVIILYELIAIYHLVDKYYHEGMSDKGNMI